MARSKPVGSITRGTTHPNRLRRCDRWLVATQGWRLTYAVDPPVAVDLGYGATPVTTLRWADVLQQMRPDLQVVGIEIDPARVERAQTAARTGVSFTLGGFEVPLPHGQRPLVVRAFNVLRQYPPDQVEAAWAVMQGRLAPSGLILDGTCDELGRLAAWIALTVDGPQTLTLSWRLAGLDRPGIVAQRLPKALIHRNVPGEPIHDLIRDLDDAWAHATAYASFGARQRFLAMVASVRERGWPVLDGPARWRLGELSVPWTCVAPAGSGDSPAGAGGAHHGP